MPYTVQYKVSGLNEVETLLENMPSRILRIAYDRALGAAGAIVQQEIEATAPIAEEGILRENGVVRVWIHPSEKAAGAKIGYNHSARSERNDVPADVIAEWVERGHWWTTHEPNKRRIKFIPGSHFMAAAAEAITAEAIERFADVFFEVLESNTQLSEGLSTFSVAGVQNVASSSSVANQTDYLEGISEF